MHNKLSCYLNLKYRCNTNRTTDPLLQDKRSDIRLIGHIQSMSIPALSIELLPDIQVTDPTDLQRKIEVVGIIKTIDFNNTSHCADTPVIDCDLRLSAENLTRIQEVAFAQTSAKNHEIAITWALYDYDHDNKTYFKRLHTPEPIIGIPTYALRTGGTEQEIEGHFLHIVPMTLDPTLAQQKNVLSFRFNGPQFAYALKSNTSSSSTTSARILYECYEEDYSSCLNAIGHLHSLSIPAIDFALTPDVQVINPENQHDTLSVVSMLRVIECIRKRKDREESPHIEITLALSSEKVALLQETLCKLALAEQDFELLLEWTVYLQDRQTQTFFKAFYTSKPMAFSIISVLPVSERLSDTGQLTIDVIMQLHAKPCQAVNVQFRPGGTLLKYDLNGETE